MPLLRVFLRGGLAVATLALPLPLRADEASAASAVSAHTTFLADDLLEGRATGTRGYNLAAAYVATQFRALGLQPAGTDGTFYQPMNLLEETRDYPAARLALHAGDAPAENLEPLKDFLAAPAAGQVSAELTAPAVFVGYGVNAPEHGYSDLAGVDLHGKVAVVFFGAPAKIPGTARAHYSNGHTKAEALAARGAVAIITVNSPAEEVRRPWLTTLGSSRFPAMTLLAADGSLVDVVPGIKLTAALSPAGVGKLFAHSPRPFAEIVAAAERNEPQHLALGVSVTLAARATQRTVSSHNVLAVLPGSDAALAHDYIVVTAHLDHLGLGPAINGDSIYNGAIDDAIGAASLLAAAQSLAESGAKPRRPILFAAVTGEEKGLLGSRFLSRNPPLGGRFAANLNIDAGPFFAPLRAVIGMGREHTTLGQNFATVATRLGWAMRPDPRPEERRFVRSDQYSFVREGIPAIHLLAFPESTDPKINLAEIDRLYWRDRYHKPDDDLKHYIDFASAGAFAVLLAETARDVADSESAPAWLPGDFFGELFGRN
ncbi:MAG: M20/M25/M40 family metallo-hydrolase [Opitutae bacterium]|nr:M20/M25/M40 family metallo-hydrolase [Opitutae bacterium]